MGVCTSKANRPHSVQKSGSRNQTVPKRINITHRHNQVGIQCATSTSSTNDEHVNNIILDKIIHVPDDIDHDPNFVLLSDLQNSSNDDALDMYDDSIVSFANGKSLTFSMMTSESDLETIYDIDHGHDEEYDLNVLNDEQQVNYKNNMNTSMCMTIGDEIELTANYNYLHGTIRFIGELSKYEGKIFYGIQLNKLKNSDDIIHWRHKSNRNNGFPLLQNDGYIDDTYYFKTYGKGGLFVTEQQIGRILQVNYDNPRIGINDEIVIDEYKCNGTIKYIGKPKVKSHSNINVNIGDIYYGIRLNKCITEGTHGLFHDRCYFSDCDKGYGVFFDCSKLSYLVIPSRYNLLIHGYFNCNCNINIASGIIKLIESFSNNVEIKCIMNNNICRKYEPYDINYNICGPAITVTSGGSNTHCTHCEVKICGYYQFRKECFVDTGDFIQKFVKKTEFQIFKLENEGGIKRIFRSIESDNKNPLLLDYKSVQMRWRHDIYRNNIDECDHQQIFKHIADLYGLLTNEMAHQLERYGIQLHGLKYL